MTVRMLQYWNGYSPDAIVTGLSNESALIAAGYATADLDGANDGRIDDAKLRTNAAGSVSLVGSDGKAAYKINADSTLCQDQNGASRYGMYQHAPAYLKGRLFAQSRAVIPFDVAATWNQLTNTGGSVSVSLDTATLFKGRPTLKAVVTGGSGTNFEIGTSAASVTVPAKARDVETVGYVLALNVPNGVTLGASCLLYLTQDGYTSFKSLGAPNDYLHKYTDSDGWTYLYFDPSFAGLTGGAATINYAAAVQTKLRITVSSAGTQPGNWYIGGLFACPASALPVVLMTVDDGYDDWNDYLLPACKERGIPVSMGLDPYYVDTAGYMTRAQWLQWIEDESGLFEATNHGYNNQSFGTVGLAQYLANVATADAYLAGLGVPDRSRYLHQYVQGSYDQTLVSAMRNLGYRSIRDTSAYDTSTRGVMTALKADNLYYLRAGVSLGNAVTVAQAIAALETAKTQPNPVFAVMGHKFEATAGSTITWIAGYDPSYGMSNYLDYLADERDAGRILMPGWGEWAAQVSRTGRAV